MRIPEKLKFQLCKCTSDKWYLAAPTGLILKVGLDFEEKCVGPGWKEKLEGWEVEVDVKRYPLYSTDEATARKIKTFLNKEFKKRLLEKDEYFLELVEDMV